MVPRSFLRLNEIVRGLPPISDDTLFTKHSSADSIAAEHSLQAIDVGQRQSLPVEGLIEKEGCEFRCRRRPPRSRFGELSNWISPVIVVGVCAAAIYVVFKKR